MNLASQTQRNVTMQGFGALSNGSMAPYHSNLNGAFLGSADKFQHFGTYVEGDASRIAAESGPSYSDGLHDSGLDLSGYSGHMQTQIRNFSGPASNIIGPATTSILGIVLIYSALDFPLGEEVIDMVKGIIKRPKAVARTVAGVAGIGLLTIG